MRLPRRSLCLTFSAAWKCWLCINAKKFDLNV
jgi:hypothetical protein